MALLSALLSVLARKVGDLLQAVFGWSITALFGRLPRKKSIAVSAALVLSLSWPLFVVGLVFPGVAAWLVAFLPLERWLGPLPLRVIWGGMALLTPPVVGLLTRWAAPRARGNAASAIANGYPLALGYAVASVITVVTVPIVKLVSLLRGHADEHLYVQPHPQRYRKVLHDLAEACVLAGLVPEVRDVPPSMALSTTVLKALARGAVDPIVADEPKLLVGGGLEIYLYPADLLLRGKPAVLARVRAMMARTRLDRDAYLVTAERAQELQDELGRLGDVIALHAGDATRLSEARARRRLGEIVSALDAAPIPYVDWVVLDRIAHRVERALIALPNTLEDDMDTKKPSTKALAVPADDGGDERSTTTLLKDAVEQAAQLVRVEVELANAELRQDVRKAKSSAIGLGVAHACLLLGVNMLSVAALLALGAMPSTALILAAVLFVPGGIAAFVGYSRLPRQVLGKTAKRVRREVHTLKEHAL